MGKKRIITKNDTGGKEGEEKATVSQTKAHARVDHGRLYIRSTYNNTALLLTDTFGNALAWATSGSLGFKGAKKGTPFAAAKVGEVMAEKAQTIGLQDVAVIVKGVGAGRESAIRAFANRGCNVSSISDATPVPHNGPRPKKPRRV